MKITLVSPAWRRYGVTDLCLAERRWLCDELAARGIEANGVIVADDDNLDIAQEYGFDTVEFPNDQGLGAKFNVGFQWAYDNGADYIIHIGSDDWVHPDWFGPLPLDPEMFKEISAAELEASEGGVVTRHNGPLVLTAGQIDIIHLASGVGMTFHKTRLWGVVPWALPRELLDKRGCDLVEPGIPRGVEGSMAGRFGGVSYVHYDLPYACVDFKTDVNVTSYERLWQLPHPELADPFGKLRAHYPDFLVDKAEALSEELVAA